MLVQVAKVSIAPVYGPCTVRHGYLDGIHNMMRRMLFVLERRYGYLLNRHARHTRSRKARGEDGSDARARRQALTSYHVT